MIASCDGIFEQPIARDGVGIWLSYLPARLNRLAESIPWNSLESIPGLLKSLKILSLALFLPVALLSCGYPAKPTRYSKDSKFNISLKISILYVRKWCSSVHVHNEAEG
jgi:hypothetical protein